MPEKSRTLPLSLRGKGASLKPFAATVGEERDREASSAIPLGRSTTTAS
jgi:hypothetical protein